MKLGPVLKAALTRKMLQTLQHGDLVSYRIVRNLQRVHLKGFAVEPVLDLVPGFGEVATDSASLVAHFCHQNGFERINEVDCAGFMPLHYASLSGDPELINALLEQRANPNKTTRKGQPLLGTPPYTSALGICMICQHNEAAQLLIAARASVSEGGLSPALHLAAQFDNSEGIRLICDSGGDPWEKDIFGASPIQFAYLVLISVAYAKDHVPKTWLIQKEYA